MTSTNRRATRKTWWTAISSVRCAPERERTGWATRWRALALKPNPNATRSPRGHPTSCQSFLTAPLFSFWCAQVSENEAEDGAEPLKEKKKTLRPPGWVDPRAAPKTPKAAPKPRQPGAQTLSPPRPSPARKWSIQRGIAYVRSVRL
jgi:hypothetical protein